MPVQTQSHTIPSIAHVVSDLVEAWNSHDIERIATCYATTFEGQDVAQPGIQCGRDGVRQTSQLYIKAFPDLYVTCENIVVQDGQVALHWKAYGTHLGSWMNIPPTKRMVHVSGVSLLTIQRRKVRRCVVIWDVAGLLRSIGLLPDL